MAMLAWLYPDPDSPHLAKISQGKDPAEVASLLPVPVPCAFDSPDS